MTARPAQTASFAESSRHARPAARPSGAVRPKAPGAPRTLGLQQVRITGGLLHEWQVRNRVATIPHAITQMTAAGNLDNLRAVAEPDSGVEFRGRYPFLDTDVFKTIEGVVYEIARDRDGAEPALVEFADRAIDLVVRAQRDDGYLNSYFQAEGIAKEPWSDLAWGHELYSLGHLIQAAVAANRVLGDDRLLIAATRFADLVWERYGPDGEAAIDGHPEVEMALVELARETGDERYLRLAGLFIDRRGAGTVNLGVFPAEYAQDHQSLRELDSVTGHAVRMMYLAAGAEDLVLEAGEPELAAALDRLWDDMVRTKLYISGGLGARHSDEAIGDRYELPAERSYSETCAAIGTMQWAWRRYLRTGDSKALDLYERVLYNAFAVSTSADGRAFFYDNPLQRRRDHQQRSGAETSGELLRRSWFTCPCCPPNIIRWVAQLQDHLAVSLDGPDGAELQIGQFAEAEISGAGLVVEMKTDYPWDGLVSVRVVAAETGRRTLALRVPSWSTNPSLTVDGEDVPVPAGGGWARVAREWAVGDEVVLELPMMPRAHVAHPKLDAVRGAVAIVRGPILYCLESQDAGADVDDVVVSPESIASAVACNASSIPHTGAFVRLDIEAAKDRIDPEELYPLAIDERPSRLESLPVTAIPYFLWGNREPGSMRVWLRRGVDDAIHTK